MLLKIIIGPVIGGVFGYLLVIISNVQEEVANVAVEIVP